MDLLVIDPRKKEEDYFNEKVREAVARIFHARDTMERRMTRDELYAFDREISYWFLPDSFRQAVYDEIDKDYGRLGEIKALYKNEKGDELDADTKIIK